MLGATEQNAVARVDLSPGKIQCNINLHFKKSCSISEYRRDTFPLVLKFVVSKIMFPVEVVTMQHTK